MRVKCSPTCFALGERQTVVLGWHPDHIGGQAGRTSFDPILAIAPFHA
jgi:hypothetical protein